MRASTLLIAEANCYFDKIKEQLDPVLTSSDDITDAVRSQVLNAFYVGYVKGLSYTNTRDAKHNLKVIRSKISSYKSYVAELEDQAAALEKGIEKFEQVEFSPSWHNLEESPNDLPELYGESRVLVKTKDSMTGEIFEKPIIAEHRNTGWYQDDFANTKLSRETTLSEVVIWKPIE
ncbi:MAG: hypothetical protein MJZ34_02660 [Paludibacteraceae bacterium]|nr:hypothetical protein [Paludibacteraceae bacterium]